MSIISKTNLDEKLQETWSAADSAAWSAYRSVDYSAWSAARSAAESVYSAARSAYWSVESAAESAAEKKKQLQMIKGVI